MCHCDSNLVMIYAMKVFSSFYMKIEKYTCDLNNFSIIWLCCAGFHQFLPKMDYLNAQCDCEEDSALD